MRKIHINEMYIYNVRKYYGPMRTINITALHLVDGRMLICASVIIKYLNIKTHF